MSCREKGFRESARKEQRMIFYFVRHGETEWNVAKKIQGTTDVPLNENGVRQARELAEKLVAEGYQIDRAYTSPQLRASVTAQIAADALGIECIPLDGLIEMNLGEWEGSNWGIIEAEYKEVYHYWNTHRRYVRTPGGECYNEVLERTFGALSDILERETGNVLVVTHSAVLMALRCYLSGRPFEEMAANFRTKNAEIIAIDAAEIRAAQSRFEQGM